jgi:hypothetical protein
LGAAAQLLILLTRYGNSHRKPPHEPHWQFLEGGDVTPLPIFLFGNVFEGSSVGYSSGVGSATDPFLRMDAGEYATFLPFGSDQAVKR